MKKFKRIREWISIPGNYMPGKRNSITDVENVKVGHYTLHESNDIHTGITIIKPHNKNVYLYKTPCAVAVGNGFGKLTGISQIEELGELESLMGLTNTLSVPQVMQGILDYHIKTTDNEELKSINIVVGETNDSYLNDIRKCVLTPSNVSQAINSLSENFLEGAVGAGSGTVCFGYKGGIGTSSRVIPGELIKENRDYTIGVLVQSNYGGNFSVYGKRIEKNPNKILNDKGSCMIVVATDAPLDSRQLKRIAKRALLGLVNTGSYMSHGSGDFCIAFSNYEKNLRYHKDTTLRSTDILSDVQLSPIFNAVVEAATEALYNSLTMSEDINGTNEHFVSGFDMEEYL